VDATHRLFVQDRELAAQQDATDKATTATLVRLDSANFAYSVRVEKGRPRAT
jgi:hypothetical protein